MSEAETSIFDRYESAIIRLATFRAIGEKSRPPLLVFASLEFAHSDRPRPDSTPLNGDGVPPHLRSPGSSGLIAYFRRVAMKATEALRWYRDAAKGVLTIPVPDDPLERGRFDGTALRSPTLVDEPAQAIELFNQQFWSRLYTHLLVRRALYENAAVGDMVIAAPLPHDMEPTLLTMLANIAGVTQPFFEGLDSLLRNGVPIERVTTALRSGRVDLAMLVDAATRLNDIDERHPYRIETAIQIVTELSQTAST